MSDLSYIPLESDSLVCTYCPVCLTQTFTCEFWEELSIVYRSWYSECNTGYIYAYARHTYIVCTVIRVLLISPFNTLRPRQNGRHFPDDIFKCIFLNENVYISIKANGSVNNISALVRIMAWHRPGDKPSVQFSSTVYSDSSCSPKNTIQIHTYKHTKKIKSIRTKDLNTITGQWHYKVVES